MITPPLQIDAIATRYGGHIGICGCPGRKYPPVITATRNRALTADLQAIRDFSAALLITLMETGELDWAGPALHELGAACTAHGIGHVYLPIVDQDIPDHHWEDRWDSHRGAFHELLRDGRNIVFHCRGGRGRAGLAAARLLIETGIEPAAAMAQVRRARPGAIETAGQEAYLLQLGTQF